MQRLVLLLVLAISPVTAGAGCGGKAGATTPTAPKVTEAPLNKDSLVVYMQERFPEHVASKTLLLEWGSEGMDLIVVKELAMLGVRTTSQLNAIVPVDLQSKGFDALVASREPNTNITGILRDVMIVHDAKKYFGEIWTVSDRWAVSGPEDLPIPVAYGVDMTIPEEAGAFSGGEGDYGDPCEGYDEGYDEGMDEGEGDPCGD